MKIPKPFLLLLGAFLAFGAFAAPHARAQVTVGYFYDTLSPYGEWVQDPNYGYCWHPTNVDVNWAPYTDGYWAYTDSGWTWVSYEDYGGVVYHYGRWANLPDEGWVWVPGETWAPAWVSWRTGDAYVGWAPLPPEARWDVGIGFSPWVDARFNIGPGFYSFVGVHDFGAPALGAVIMDRERNVDIINSTTNITNITVNNTNVFVGGPSYAKYSALSSRPIPTLKLVRQTDAAQIRAAGGKVLAHQEGNQLMVLAPRVSAPAGGVLPAPAKVAKVLTGGKANHGWEGVKDPQVREKLQAQIKQQAQAAGPENAPARAVRPEELKAVNQRIKTQGAAKPLVANEAGTPKPGKGKKTKAPATTDLENAPATEEPGAAAATPKAKGKNKKAHATPDSSLNGAEPATEGTPKPKKAKSKKAKTPGLDETGSTDTEAPAKHSKSSDSDLHPFVSDDSAKPKPKKIPEGSEISRDNEDHPAGEVKTPKAGTGDKKKKDEGNNPPGQ